MLKQDFETIHDLMLFVEQEAERRLEEKYGGRLK